MRTRYPASEQVASTRLLSRYFLVRFQVASTSADSTLRTKGGAFSHGGRTQFAYAEGRGTVDALQR